MKILLRLKPYLLKYKKKILLGLFCTLLANLSGVLAPLVIKNAINNLQHEMSFNSVMTTAGLILIISMAGGFFLYMTRRTIIIASREIEFDLRNDFFSHLLSLPIRFYQNTPTGDLMAHATNDINAVRNFLGPAILYSSDTIVAFTLIMVIMISMSPILTLYSFLPLPFISIFVYLTAKNIHKRFEDVQAQYSVLTARAQESLSGIRIVKSYVREVFEIASFRKISQDYLKKNMKLAIIQSLLFPLMIFLIGISLLVVIWFGGKMVIEDKLTLGDMTAFIIYLGWLIWPMIAFGWVTNLVQQSAASMKRISKILDIKSEIKDLETTDHSITTISGNIELRNLSFRYKEDLPYVLNNINLKIPFGSTLAIIGYTGSGKSTLINLISRSYDISDGEIMMDERNIKDIPLKVLRNNIGYVTQETFLFSTSIKDNITFGVSDFTEEDILKAADISQISKDINTFQNKYDTIVGERGITLSGGQKQRVSIARAIIKNPKILILDDCLSAVDTYTEEQILQKLSKFMEGRTSIIISHRISTIRNADNIIVLEGGSIKEEGTHNELLKIGGIYADLYNKQLLEEEIDEM